jgi:hypothetical protein
MDILLNEKILAALLGFLGGTMATIFGHWVHWGIEKRRDQLAARKEQIKNWRTMVQKVWQEEWSDKGEIEFLFIQELEFLSLKPMLSKHTRGIFESLVSGDITVLDREVFEALLADISDLEKKWKLL